MASRAIFSGQAPTFVFPTSLGTNGQVLESDGTAVVWGSGSSGQDFSPVVVQTGAQTDPVTLNTPAGTIETVGATIASQQQLILQLNNSLITPNTVIRAWLRAFSTPITVSTGVFAVNAIPAGSGLCAITICNISTASVGPTVFTVQFELIQQN